MEALVYWNSHKKCWSVKEKLKPVWHTNSIWLKDCKFVVREAGVEKARLTKKKNVHAFVKGTIVDSPNVPIDINSFRRFTYHYNIGKFYYVDSLNSELKKCRVCAFIDNYCFASTY